LLLTIIVHQEMLRGD